MTLGAMTWTCLLLTAAAPPDVWHLNQKAFQIPIRFDAQRRAEIRELDLYVSHDQGQTWNLEGRATPDKEYFPYVAREDGPYWFTVVVIDLKGQQTPPDVHAAPVGQRIVVDTVRPDVKMTAERQGDTVQVNWAITEEHPKPETLKLEYAESANGPWTNGGDQAGADRSRRNPDRGGRDGAHADAGHGGATRAWRCEQVPGVNGAGPPWPRPSRRRCRRRCRFALAGAAAARPTPPIDPPPAPPADTRRRCVSNWTTLRIRSIRRRSPSGRRARRRRPRRAPIRR